MTRHEDQAVYLRCVARRSPDGHRFSTPDLIFDLTHAFDQDEHILANQCPVLAEGNRLLRLHDPASPLFGDLGRYWIAKRSRHRARFRRIGEDADVVELLRFDKGE